MIAPQRARHARTWALLAPLLLAGLIAGLLARPPRPVQPPLPAATQPAQGDHP